MSEAPPPERPGRPAQTRQASRPGTDSEAGEGTLTEAQAEIPAGTLTGTRAYIRRRGRLTVAQERALREQKAFLVPPDAASLNIETLFGRKAPLGLEIGFGMGHALLDWAVARPDWNLLGIEIYQPGIGALLLGIERLGLSNIRAVEASAEQWLAHSLAAASLDEVRIFFPDPWPKARHHKRRLVQPAFAALLADRLRPGGLLWLATDWGPYAEWMLEVLEAEPRLENEAGPGAYADAGTARSPTRFETRGRRLGHDVWDLRYRRKH